MADVLIKGMEMPKEGFVEILIRSDGTIVQTGQSKRLNGRDYYVPYEGAIPQLFTAVSIPPHGRLIDADEAIKTIRGLGNRDYRREKGTISDALKMLISDVYTPTIIPASEV